LDFGINEWDFWNMTYGEVERAIESKRRVQEREAKEKASYDYVLGNLIGISVARVYNEDTKYPEIYDVYPNLFDKEKIEAERYQRTMELSAQRFMTFAKSFNDKFAEKEGKDKE
jgi:hypothetical protein